MDIEQTELQNNRQPKNSLFQQKEILLPLITAIIATYIHFWGYAYLKGKFQMVGLGDIEIELSILESVYQASLSFNEVFKLLANIDGVGLLTFCMFLMVLFVIFVFCFFLGDLTGSKLNNRKNRTNPNARDYHPVLKSFYSGVSLVTGTYVLVLVFCVFAIFLMSTSTIFLGLPRSLGHESGKVYIEKAVCRSVKKEEVKRGGVVPCTRLKVKNGESHVGVILFKNNQYTIMVTNEKSLLLDKQNKLIAWSEVFEREPETKTE